MKLYLDDVRPCPPGWTLAKTAREAIELLEEGGDIVEVSLDHDLADEHYPWNGGRCGDGLCGCAVALWLKVHDFQGLVHLHTMNPAGRDRMKLILLAER